MRALRSLLLALLLTGCSSFRGEVEWTKYPGALQAGSCARYASTVSVDLRARGLEAYYVEYDWAVVSEGNNLHGAHAVVVFRISKDWFVVDNESAKPRMVREGTLLEMVKQVSPWVTKIRNDLDIVHKHR